MLGTADGARVPEMPGICEIQFPTNSSMMWVDFLPKHLIVGAIYLGLEFARSALRREVTTIELGGC